MATKHANASHGTISVMRVLMPYETGPTTNVRPKRLVASKERALCSSAAFVCRITPFSVNEQANHREGATVECCNQGFVHAIV